MIMCYLWSMSILKAHPLWSCFPRVWRRPTPIPRPLRTTPCWSSTTRAAAPRPDRSAPFTPPAAEATRTMTTSTTGALASANSPTCTEATTTSLRHHRRTTKREGRTGGGGKLKETTSKKQCGTFFLIAGRGQCAESKQWRNQYTLKRQRMKRQESGRKITMETKPGLSEALCCWRKGV